MVDEERPADPNADDDAELMRALPEARARFEKMALLPTFIILSIGLS
jgi:hypothetical protein